MKGEYVIYVTLEPILFKSLTQKESKNEISCGFIMNKEESISRLMCNTFNQGDIMSFFTDAKDCTNIGYKISTNLIRVATQRIYSDPYRSFIEPVVNSIDAYNLKRGIASNTGKFGMGFFSLLYWLIPNGSMKIESRYLQGNKVCKWIAYISYHDEEFYFTLKESGIMEDTNTGLYIAITLAEEIPLRIGIFDNLIDNTFRLVSDYSIINRNKNINEVHSNMNIVIERDITRSVSFTDDATGIDLQTFFTKLLIPSVSSKTIAKSLTTELTYTEPKSQAFKDKKTKDIISQFYINIRGISLYYNNIYDFEINLELSKLNSTEGIFLNNEEYYTRYIWTLPDQTPLPVSRDDIILSNPIFYDEARKSLIALLQDCIDKNISVENLLLHLRKYSDYAIDENVYRLIGDVQEYLRNMKIYLVPRIYQYFYTKIIKSYTNKIYVGVDRLSLSKLTDHVLNIKGITRRYDFLNKTVLLIKGMKKNISLNYTTAGLSGILFVDEEFSRQSDWMQQIASNSVAILYTKKSNLSKEMNTLLSSSTLYMYNWKSNRSRKGPNYMPEYMRKYADLIETMITREDVRGHYEDAREDLFTYLYTITHQLSTISRDEDFLEEAFNIIYSSLYSVTNRNIEVAVGKPDILMHFNPNLLDDNLMKYFINIADIEISNRLSILAKSIDLRYLLDYLYLYFNNLARNNNSHVLLFNPVRISPFNAAYSDNPLYILYMQSLIEFVQNKPVIYGFIYAIFSIKIYEESKGNRFLVQKYFQYIYDELNFKYGIASIDRMINNHYVNPVNEEINILRKNLTLGLTLIEKAYNQNNYTINYSIPNIEYDYGFTASTLIAYLFDNDVNSSKLDWMKDISESKYDITQFQALEIAINEGTSKSYIESVISEMTQNSIDAAREYLSNKKSVLCKVGNEYNILEYANGIISHTEYKGNKISDLHCLDLLHLQIGKMKKQYAITMHDEVGIANAGILAVMLPFYSTKKASNVYSTGEMGTGFMNVYRQPYCKEVYIDTFNDKEHVVLKVTPIVKNERVVDLHYEVKVSREVGQGTNISIILNDNLDYVSLISEALIYGNGFYPSINMRSYINNVLSYTAHEILFENTLARVSLRRGITSSSIMLTNGIPYSWLRNFIPEISDVKSYASYNIIVDLKKEAYKPQQSRKRIIFSDRQKDLFNETIILAAILHGIDSVLNARNVTISSREFSGINYEGDVNQILPSIGIEINKAKMNTPLIRINLIKLKIPAISDLILEIMSKLWPSDITGKLTESVIRPYLLLVINKIPIEYDMVRKYYSLLIVKWFSNKTFREKITKTEDKRKNISQVVIDFLNEIVKHAWNRAKNMISINELSGFKINREAPNVRYDLLENSIGGYYSNTNHEIVLNEVYYDSNTSNAIQQVVRNKKKDINLVRTNEILNNLIGNQLKAVTLVHEFLHALKSQEHTLGGHSNIKFVLYDHEYDLAFDATANKLWSALIVDFTP